MSNFKKSSQQVNTVYKTNDLTMFKSITGNRPTNPQHIRRLTDSIKVNGLLCNPILVNEKMEVIDGQHRLEACKNAESEVYYIILTGYSLSEVQTLNLNQKNWQKKDFMNGYADKGIKSYVILREFYRQNNDFSLGFCVKLLSNRSGSDTAGYGQKFKANVKSNYNKTEVFNEGTWKVKDYKLGQRVADMIRLVKPYYAGYARDSFASSILTLILYKEEFDFNTFMQRLRQQPTALVDCSSVGQYKALIEDIYNYRSRNKVNLRI